MDDNNIPLCLPVLRQQNRMIIIDNVYYEEEITEVSDDETVQLITSNIDTNLNVQNVEKIQFVKWCQKPVPSHLLESQSKTQTQSQTQSISHQKNNFEIKL